MKVGTLTGRWPRVAGHAAPDKKSKGLAKKDLTALRELDRVWLGLVLHLLRNESLASPLALGITSALQGEGKTTNCLGLSAGLAKETDAKVLLVDCDFGSTGIAGQMDLDPKPGLAEHLIEGTPIEYGLRDTRLPNFKILVAGGEESRVSTEWESWEDVALSGLRRKLPDILTNLKDKYSYIVLDLPPLFTNIYTKHILHELDGTLLVVREGVTPMESVPRAVKEIGDERLLSVLLIGGVSRLPFWIARLLPE